MGLIGGKQSFGALLLLCKGSISKLSHIHVRN